MADGPGHPPTTDPDPGEVAAGYARILDRFVSWAQAEDPIRGAVVIGSRARQDHPADVWADLDIVVVSTDPGRYAHSAEWAGAIGEPWISFVEVTPDGEGLERRVLFAGGLDVDFAFVDRTRLLEAWTAEAAAVFARGARLLIDKDGLLDHLESPPALSPPPRPDAERVEQVASDFWYHAVWTAKHLRRGETWWAKGGCDTHMKALLRIALEWDAAAQGRDHWFRGRYFEEWADPNVVQRLGPAFARYDEGEIWTALARTMDLFAEVARRATQRLALPYPAEAEARARQLVESYAEGRDERSAGTGVR
jgi:aminoglycoside 6-adenylyltransferase